MVAEAPGQFVRLGEVARSHLGVVGGDTSAGGERPGHHGRVANLPRDRQGFFGLIEAVDGDDLGGERGLVGECPRPYPGRHLDAVCGVVAEDGVVPGQSFLDTAPP